MSAWDLGSIEGLSRLAQESPDPAIKAKAVKALHCVLDEVPKKAEANELRALGHKVLFATGLFGIMLIVVLWMTRILSLSGPSVTLVALCAGSLVVGGKQFAGK